MNCAIIFNCDYNGLSIIQALGQVGIKCIAMDCRRSVGTYSKYAHYVKCPDPLVEEDRFIQFLFNYCQAQDTLPILFPTNDHWAIAVSRNKKRLEQVSIPCVAKWNTINLLTNKDEFYKIGMKRNYLTPFCWQFDKLDLITESDYPVVIKPLCRRTSSMNNHMQYLSTHMDRLRFILIHNKSELFQFIKREAEFLPYLIIQKYVNGLSDCMYTVGIYADQNSTIIGLFTGRKVRGYPAEYGDCIVGEIDEVPISVTENTLRIIKEISYSGLAEFEYKRDSITGDFFLIEINPRSWSWIGITPLCGVNLPLIAYKNLIGEDIAFIRSSTNSGKVRYTKLIRDIENSLFHYRKDHLDWIMSPNQLLNDYKGKKNVFAEFHARDWPVGLYAIIEFLKRCITRTIKKNRWFNNG